MKISKIYTVLATFGIWSVAATEDLSTASFDDENDAIITPFNNYGGWVNPEDLTPMPQCIAQQDQSAWLETMTKCTGKRCTRHFGVFCTHHQWLTELTCLNAGFSFDVLRQYLPYCSRSVLAKAQLYQWIHEITGRTWFIDVGDASGLQSLSPASLAKGYTSVDAIYKAPTCLSSSLSVPSMEHFRAVIISCSFTSTTKHYGNAARPWEYNQQLGSMTTLDFQTVGYTNLTGHDIYYGDNFFDKDCFCKNFAMDLENEPCPGQEDLDLTEERLWMKSICGSQSLPDNWKDQTRMIGFNYMLKDDWRWPTCVTDMPKRVTDLPHQCAMDACEVDSNGFCRVRRSIDRACVCRSITYESCGGLCQFFETRREYVKWLHDLCGNVHNWNGLPNNWPRLAAPTTFDMIPWEWAVKSSINSTGTSVPTSDSSTPSEQCPSNEWKIRSLVIVNIATLLAAVFSRTTNLHRIARGFLWLPHPHVWIVTGFYIAALQLLAYWFSAFLVQSTSGYEDVPIVELILLWCTLPRPAWFTIILIGVQPFRDINISAAASSLVAEIILQCISVYYMAWTVNYGWQHNLYFDGMKGAERESQATTMYYGALAWAFAVAVVFAQILRYVQKLNRLTETVEFNSLERQTSTPKVSSIADELVAQVDNYCTWLEEHLAAYWTTKSESWEEAPLLRSEGGVYTVYGTVYAKRQSEKSSRKEFVRLYAIIAVCMIALWIAQWFFWIGYIGLSMEEFCPPNLSLLTIIWTAFSLPGATVGASV